MEENKFSAQVGLGFERIVQFVSQAIRRCAIFSGEQLCRLPARDMEVTTGLKQIKLILCFRRFKHLLEAEGARFAKLRQLRGLCVVEPAAAHKEPAVGHKEKVE
jgi:hypothetical protein